MKKLKGFLLCLLGCFMVVALSAGLFACSETGNQGNDGKDDGKTDKSTYRLSSISLDTGDAKTEYTIGDEFSAAGLKVTAGFVYDGGTASEDVTEDAVIDAANFNNKKTGTYAINIGYTFRGVTLYNNYRVNVTSDILGTIAGLELTYDGERQFAVPAKDAQTMPSIDLSKLTVNKITGTDASDTKSETLASGDYALSYSINGGQRAEVSGTSIPVTEAGTYSVFARAETSVGTENFTMEGFITFYAVDEVKSLAVSGGKTEFEYNTEETIGGDMTYTVTYASGATKVVPFGDASLTVEGIDNKATGTNTANVTYTETYLSFDSELGAAVSNTATATATFEYKIGENPDAGKQQTDKFVVNFDTNDWTTAASNSTHTVGKDGTMDGTDGILTFNNLSKPSSKTASSEDETRDFKNTIQFGAYPSRYIELDLTGYDTTAVATVSIYASTSGSDTRYIAAYSSTEAGVENNIEGYKSVGFTTSATAYLTTWEFAGGAKYYIGSTGSTINFFEISVSVTYISGGQTTDEYSVNFDTNDWTTAANNSTHTVGKDGTMDGTGGILTFNNLSKPSSKTASSEDETRDFKNTIQFGAYPSRYIELDLTGYDTTAVATVSIYASTSGSDTRYIAAYSSTEAGVENNIEGYKSVGFTTSATAYLTTWEFAGGAKYYIGSTGSTINFFEISVSVTYTSGGGETEPKDIALDMYSVYQYLNGVEEKDALVKLDTMTELVSDDYETTGITVIRPSGMDLQYSPNNGYNCRLKLGEKIGNGALMIKTEDKATITIQVRSGSSSETRAVGIYTNIEDQTSIVGTTQDAVDGMAEMTFEVFEAGTYYLGSFVGAVNIYYISIEY